MFSITKMPSGHLQLAADAAAREFILEQMERGRTSDEILMEGTEHYWTNGSFHPFDAGSANPFVGLTCAPCIAESMDYSDDGSERKVEGKLWWYPAYEVSDPVQELLKNGQVVFTAAH